jgi:hypothetical protein
VIAVVEAGNVEEEEADVEEEEADVEEEEEDVEEEEVDVEEAEADVEEEVHVEVVQEVVEMPSVCVSYCSYFPQR